MSTREMICHLVSDAIPNEDLDLLYQLILKFVPAVPPEADELEAIQATSDETEWIPHDKIHWDE